MGNGDWVRKNHQIPTFFYIRNEDFHLENSTKKMIQWYLARPCIISGQDGIISGQDARTTTHLPHPKLSHNEKWSFGDLRLAIAT